MSTVTENNCPRFRDDCTPAANVCSDGEGATFICVGWNLPQNRHVPGDRFTLCWKNDVVDERGYWDKRDLLDTMSVIAQSLSTDENIRVNEGLDEAGMQQANMLS